MDITHRNAILADVQLILDWRNSAGARKFSVNSEILTLDDHTSWMISRLLKIQSDPFLIFFEKGIALGSARFDYIPNSKNDFEISILVDPKVQGNGVGTRILHYSCKFFFDLYPMGTITARVHELNYASQKIFTKNGFKRVSLVQGFLLYKLNSTLNS